MQANAMISGGVRLERADYMRWIGWLETISFFIVLGNLLFQCSNIR